MACLAAFGLSWMIGWLICRGVLRSLWRDLPLTLRLGLGWAAGAAFSGMTTFWAMVLVPQHRPAAVGAAAVAALMLYFVPTAGRPDDLAQATPSQGRRTRAAWGVGASVFAGLLALWVARCLHMGIGAPAGGWDAFSIWNQRARFFFLCPEEWTRACDPVIDWSHPEYPGLLPSLVAYGWLPEGRCLALSPVAVALLTQVSKLLLIVGFIQAAYSRTAWSWVFGSFYATIPQEWTQQEAWQYADRPLAVFLLAGIGCLALAIRRTQRPWYFLAGLFWGAASFCKDEGKAALAVLAAGAALGTLCSLCHGGGWRSIGNLVLLTLGLGPGLGSLALQWAYSPVPTKLIELMTADPLRDSSRTALIFEHLRKYLNEPYWGGMWWACAAVFVTLAPWLRRRELWLLWVFPTIQLMVYLLIFQLTPQPLQWHLESALPRLLFHISPIVFLASAWLILEAQGATRLAAGAAGLKTPGMDSGFESRTHI